MIFPGPFPFQIALIAIFAGVILVLLITILVILFRKRICCSNSKHHDDKDGMDKTSGTSTESSGEFYFELFKDQMFVYNSNLPIEKIKKLFALLAAILVGQFLSK